MNRKWSFILLLIILLVNVPGNAEDRSPATIDGYAARWILIESYHGFNRADITLSDGISGSVNEPIGKSNFDELYPEYVPIGSFQWLEEWISDCAAEPVVIGDQMVLRGGTPYICIEESGCPVLAEARESAAALDAFAFGHPFWVIGQWQDWLLCVTNFSNWVYEDEPTSLEYGWVHSRYALQLPAGLWGGSLDESIEAGDEWMVTGDAETPLYSTPEDSAELMALLPAQTELPVYPCILDDAWAIVWYEDRWGYVHSENVNHRVELEGIDVTFMQKP